MNEGMGGISATPVGRTQVNARELRERIERDVQQAIREAQEAAAAQRVAVQEPAPAPPPPPGAPPSPPPPPGREVFRVQADGRVVNIDEQGVTVTQAQVQDPVGYIPGIPPGAVAISLAFFAMVAFILVGWPIARALARRMDRSTPAVRASVESTEQLRRIEQAVEAMSIEVERISEGQRFVTRLLTDRPLGDAARQGALPAADPLPRHGDGR